MFKSFILPFVGGFFFEDLHLFEFEPIFTLFSVTDEPSLQAVSTGFLHVYTFTPLDKKRKIFITMQGVRLSVWGRAYMIKPIFRCMYVYTYVIPIVHTTLYYLS
jgi:hypothetical protein